MGKAFDMTGSYEALLARLALSTLAVATLMLFLPRYATLHTVPPQSSGSPAPA